MRKPTLTLNGLFGLLVEAAVGEAMAAEERNYRHANASNNCCPAGGARRFHSAASAMGMREGHMSWQSSLRKIIALCIAGLSTIGCQMENVGSIERSPDVTAAFESLRVPSDHRYYFLNQENNPFGVAGLKSGWVIESPEWPSVEPSSPVFKKVVDLVKGFPAQGGRSEGFIILDRQKNPIGIWYSSLGAGITVDPSTKRVMITTTKPWMQQ
jgi:hypothetical protein